MAPSVNPNGGSSTLEIAQSNQDLINDNYGAGGGGGGKTIHQTVKRRFILAAVIITVVIVALIIAVTSVTASSQHGGQHMRTGDDDKDSNRSKAIPAIALEEILRGDVTAKPFNATWVSESELLYTTYNGDLILYDLHLGNFTVLLSANDPILESGFKYVLSADRVYLCVFHFFQKVYRFSYRTRLTVIHLETGTRSTLAHGNGTDFSLFKWSPKGHSFLYVYESNIYYRVNVTNTTAVQLTFDDKFVTNGVPDWVYEEEIFSSNSAVWFSPDGTHLAYARFDDTYTPLMVLPIYGQPGSPVFQYPRANVIKYPKAGAPNPHVSLHLIQLDVTTNTSVELAPPVDVIGPEGILAAVTWANWTTISATWMNRVQNTAVLVLYNIGNETKTTKIAVIKEEKGWLELFQAPHFAANGTEMSMILSQDQGRDLGRWKHVVHMSSLVSNVTMTPLTNGTFTVTKLLGWNEANHTIFYLGTTETDPGVQHFYATDTKTRKMTCLSCQFVSIHTNSTCLHNTVECSTPTCQYYVHSCAGVGIPYSAIYRNQHKLMVWERNQHLVHYVGCKQLPIIRRLRIDINDSYTAHVLLKLPPNYEDGRKYPMVVNVYAGPDSNQVSETFQLDWGSYLASNKSIIYALIDGRGSGLKGDRMLFEPYRRLGSVEVYDQINVTAHLQRMYSFIDPNRTAIWGWSYGGYASGMALATDTKGVFKCGMSVAPVTDWALYDSIYTERFMGLPLPADNLKGYKRASLLTKFKGLKGKQYFLIHGTYDDNVHYQQSMMWAKVLEQNDILFRQQSYPDEDHGLGSVRPHLYHSLGSFLDECFQQN